MVADSFDGGECPNVPAEASFVCRTGQRPFARASHNPPSVEGRAWRFVWWRFRTDTACFDGRTMTAKPLCLSEALWMISPVGDHAPLRHSTRSRCSTRSRRPVGAVGAGRIAASSRLLNDKNARAEILHFLSVSYMGVSLAMLMQGLGTADCGSFADPSSNPKDACAG